MKKKWGIYGLAVVLGASLVLPVQAFFNPGRWMDPSGWFGNNNRNYGPPPPRPMPAQAYPPAYGQPAPYAYPAPAMAPTPVAPLATTPAPAATPAATYNAPPTSAVYNKNTPKFIPSNSNSGLKWPDEQPIADSLRKDQSFSFAPAEYLQDSDSTK